MRLLHLLFLLEDEGELTTIKVGVKNHHYNKNYQIEPPVNGFMPVSIRYDADWLIVRLIENTEEKQPDTLIWLLDGSVKNDALDDLSIKLSLVINATSKVTANIEEEQLLVHSEDGGVKAIDLNDSLVSHRLSL